MGTYILVGILLVAVVLVLILNRQPKKESNKLKQKSREYKKENQTNKGFSEIELIDYTTYDMSKIEKSRYALTGMGVLFLIGYVFYHSFLLSTIISLLGLLYSRTQLKNIIKKRQDQLLIEFKDALYSIYTSLSAGDSAKNAIIKVVKDMEDLYADRDNFIIEEFSIMKRKLDLNLDIEDVLNDFAHRSGLEDVTNFVDVFLTGLETGEGNEEIIKNAINSIMDKIEIKRDIEVMISEKKFESKIMSGMPIFLILFLSLSAPDYFAPMYTTLMGRIAMTGVGIGLILASMLANKIMRIEV